MFNVSVMNLASGWMMRLTEAGRLEETSGETQPVGYHSNGIRHDIA